MGKVFDTTHNCSAKAAALVAAGYETIIRYYCVDANKWKRIGAAEAQTLSAAGLKLCAVYQDRQDRVEDFSEAKGRLAGQHAFEYAQTAIMQPENTAIYFSADFDPPQNIVANNIMPFFKGVRDAMTEAHGGGLPYRIGIYGSGLTCRMLLDANLAELAWLAQSTGFREYPQFLASKRWCLSQLQPGVAVSIPGDPDDTNPALLDYGAFTLPSDHFGPALPPTALWSVNAGNGLRLRGGPGTNFDPVGLLTNGQAVSIVKRDGDWAQVDINGDGSPEGYVLASFLKPSAAGT
jgi:hypothetical protein